MDSEAIWAMYFTAIASMQYHPGAGRGDHQPLNMVTCAHLADAMLEIHRRRYPCPGSQPEPASPAT